MTSVTITMLTYPRLLVLLSVQLGLLIAQDQVWDLSLCKTREYHWKLSSTDNEHGYIYSGRSRLLDTEEVTLS